MLYRAIKLSSNRQYFHQECDRLKGILAPLRREHYQTFY